MLILSYSYICLRTLIQSNNKKREPTTVKCRIFPCIKKKTDQKKFTSDVNITIFFLKSASITAVSYAAGKYLLNVRQVLIEIAKILNKKNRERINMVCFTSNKYNTKQEKF